MFQVIESSTSEPQPPTKQKAVSRPRLKPSGVAILEEHWRQCQPEIPGPLTRQNLLAQIQAIPGCSDYDIGRLLQWFKGHRTKWFTQQKNSQAGGDSCFYSLTTESINALNILLKGDANPSEAVVNTWSTLLAPKGARLPDVVTYVRQARYEMHEHLPTPAQTLSPESSMSPASPTFPPHNPFKRDQTRSPILSKMNAPQNMLRRACSSMLSSSTRASPRSMPAPYVPRAAIPPLEAIIKGVSDALATPTTLSVPPRTAAEFDAMFAPFEKQMQFLVNALEPPTT